MLISMATHDMGELSNLNGIGTLIKLYPSHSICCILGVTCKTTPTYKIKDANRYMDVILMMLVFF